MKLQRVKCFFGFHDRKTFVHNFRSASDENFLATVGWCHCNTCGWSKIKFFYGN